VICVRSAEVSEAGPWNESPRIPSAVDAYLITDLAANSHPTAGSRPLPRIEDLQASARAWGLKSGGAVVVYDHEGGLQAARAWWVLRWAGVEQVRLLDGGYAAWVAAGLPVTTAAGVPPLGDVELSAGQMPQLDADASVALARTGLLLDSRIRSNYEGGASAKSEPARGHIPGAVSVPAAANLDAAGAFLDAAGLRALYAAAGVDGAVPVGVYCGAGVSAAHDVLALASIGIEAPMYVGSWSAYSSDPTRPVARGPNPG
jgi:thiosulfate/3-mercaptopyruvate sulfurtransferase